VLLASLLCIARAEAADPVPEPDGFWTGPMQGAVPATVAGGALIETAELATLIATEMPVMVDVSPLPHKPDNVAAEAWVPPPHRTIPFSVWLPGVGGGEIPARVDGWYRAWLKALTDGDRSRPIVIFCHPNCWGSWNAAKRAIQYGYTSVHWYEQGIEGWQDAGHETDVAQPESPPS
jgi:PQQ-dependent catabolism-associated CXXCW motif protein